MKHLRRKIIARMLWGTLISAIVIAPTFGSIFFFAKVALWLMGLAVFTGTAVYLRWAYRKIERLMGVARQAAWVAFEYEHVSIGDSYDLIINVWISTQPSTSLDEVKSQATWKVQLGFNSVSMATLRAKHCVACEVALVDGRPELLVESSQFVGLIRCVFDRPWPSIDK